MAAIDSLLRLIATQKADALRLRPDSAPALLREDGERPLSMPPLPAQMVAGFVAEIAPPGLDPAPDAPLEFTHVTGTGEPFRVRAERAGGRLTRVTFHPGAGPAPARSPAPPAEATDSPAVEAALSGAAMATPTPAPAPGSPSGRDAAGGARSTPSRGAPPPPSLLGLLADAAARDASDVFLSTGRPARWRLQGNLVTVDGVVPGPGDLEALLGAQLGEAARARLAAAGSVDLAWVPPTAGGGPRPRYRVSLFREEEGLAAAFRPIRTRIPSPEELHLPVGVTRLAEHRHGLVLMTGPTGSGKSTTLAALIEQQNRTVARHVITIEDPIEFRYAPKRCLIHQRELGTHVTSFAEGLRSALRSAPDVILVGEMRDPETIAAALTAAETGHLVLSTLHCGTAGMAVDRIVDAFPRDRQNQVRLQLADVLRCVVRQRLIPGAAGGRVPAVEILQITAGVAALVREGRGHQIATQIQTGRDVGMVPFERSLAELVRAGLVTSAAAMDAADDPAHLQALLGR